MFNFSASKSRWRRAVATVATVAVLAMLVAAFWLDRQFEEPGAVEVASLLKHFDSQSVMAVLAHPDDEIQIAGVLADAGMRREAESWTLTLTRGEAAVTQMPISGPGHLARIRTGELHKFGASLGLDEQAVLDYPDGGLRNAQPDSILNDVVRHIRRWKPEIIVTFDAATGLTLHPDHMVAGDAARKAFYLAGDASYEPSIGVAHQPGILVVVLAPRRMLRRFGGDVGQKISKRQAVPQYAIEVSARLKVQGWAIHQSQRHVIREVFGVPPQLLYWFWDKEHYAIVEDATN